MGPGVSHIASVYGPVSDDLPLVSARLLELASAHDRLLGETLEHVFHSGGKRIRPALVLLSGRLGTYPLDQLVTLAVSLEVVHTATLVHDDTIDGALTRRGVPTVSSVWDGKVAILVGDFLLALSAQLASLLDNVRIMRLLSETVMAMSSGELRQYAASSAHAVDEGDYFQRIAGKTASLFAMCCEGAAVVSGQSEPEIAALRGYGFNLGLAFQIADDVLDFRGDEKTLGKPAGNDLLQGTITLPVILLAARLPADAPLRRDIAEGRNVEAVVEAVRHSDVLDTSIQRATHYAHRAGEDLQVFPDSEAKEALVALTEQVIERNF
jgi:geranylgeranyl pyrophosphate synthase